jgi:hypothetical protein
MLQTPLQGGADALLLGAQQAASGVQRELQMRDFERVGQSREASKAGVSKDASFRADSSSG